MEKNARVLTLGDWPSRPPQTRNLPLSPITKRILSQVHFEPYQLLPITYQQFLQTHPHSPHSKLQLEQYREQIQRRKKQVTILSQIRNNYILGQDYGPLNCKQSRTKSKKAQQLRSNSKQYSQALQQQKERSSSKVSRKLSRVGSEKSSKLRKISRTKHPNQAQQQHSPNPKEESDYFTNFHTQKLRIQSHFKEQESTKSNQIKKSKVKQPEHEEYGYFGAVTHSKVRERKASKLRTTRLDSSRQICEELLKTVSAWEELDRAHMKEVEKMGDLSARERERLCKIQSLQKLEMNRKMQGLKSRLKSESHA